MIPKTPPPPRIVGNAKRGQVEVRYDDLGIDEVVAVGHVHLERMNDNEFALIVESKRERVCINLSTRRALINSVEVWRDTLLNTSPQKGRR